MRKRFNTRVAVIGAGIAGLSAGYQLKKFGLSPVILEAENFVGGRMSSETVDGFLLEKAAYTFPEFHKNISKFLDTLGMSKTLIPTSGTSSTFAKGREYQIKIGSPTDFLRYKLLSLKNKKDMIQIFLYAQSLGAALDLANPNARTFELEKETATDYVLRAYDSQILEYIAWPIFCEIFLGSPEGNSKAPFLATLKNLTRFKIFSFNQGMGLLPERMKNELDVRLNSPVEKILPAVGDGPVTVEVGGENPSSMEFDAIIFAIPIPLVPDILDGMSSKLTKLCCSVTYSRSLVVTLAMDKPYPETTMINNLCRDTFHVVGTLVFDHHKGADRMPKNKGLMTAILTDKASRRLFDASIEQVTSEVLEEVDSLFSHSSDHLLFSKVYRWRYGGVQLPPGALRMHCELRNTLFRDYDRIAFAGDGLYKASLELSFNSGIDAANHIIANMG